MASVVQRLFSVALAAYSAAPVAQRELKQPTPDAASMQSIVNRVLHAAKDDINAIPALLYAAAAPFSGESKVAAFAKGVACFMNGFLREEKQWSILCQFDTKFDPQMRKSLQTVFDRQFNLEITLLAGSIEPRIGALMLVGGVAAGQLEIPTPVQNVVDRVKSAFDSFVSFKPST
ncbi:hypothetical protein COB21_03685 [Candidatus Aerophobetes bacterium]|uniref:Uncharacterized protein n=1 Tax=Aerophobetes bacterium TaxID=2030807 RepID=A0A2A4X314_UNCAE|nr:MAG: hypothetical protein COB21_03685 [Candidatus Aerophobetes bacterium]